MFSIITCTTLVCQSGHKKDTTYGSPEGVLRIPLTDASKKPICSPNTNIQSLIDGYYQPKDVDKGNCDDCKSKMVEEKSVQQPPNILLVQLARYNDAGKRVDINIIPSHTITFFKHQYRLKSIIEHHGNNLNVGHYKSVIYSNNNKYVVLDDDKFGKKS